MNDPDRLAEIRARIQAASDVRHQRPPSYLAAQIWLDLGWLVGEVEGLRTELAAALGGWQWEAGAMIERGREVDRLRDLLARLEWAVNCYDDPRCPVCGAYKHGQPPAQHDPGCELAAVLHPEREKTPEP